MQWHERRHSLPGENYFAQEIFELLKMTEEEVRSRGHSSIRTEHLLLAVIRSPSVRPVLSYLLLDAQEIREKTNFIISIRGNNDEEPAQISVTEGVRKVFELADDEREMKGSLKTTTSHVLIALVREGEGIAAGVLESLGANLEKTREAVRKTRRQSR